MVRVEFEIVIGKKTVISIREIKGSIVVGGFGWLEKNEYEKLNGE